MSFPRYPKYKDSGVEWLGEVPEHWEVMALRRLATRIQTGSTPPTAEAKYYEDGTIPWYGPAAFNDRIEVSRPAKFLHASAESEGAARMFAPGATLVITIGATIGKVSSLPHTASCNQQITAIEIDQRLVHSRFATYQLKRLEPSLRAIAPSATLPILDQGEISGLWICVPPIEEQTMVAEFLNRETGKIDELVAEQQRLMELLKEKRQAVISHAVTKGLNPRVPMKPSGIEWLGDVPAHWEVTRLKKISPSMTVGIVVNPSSFIADEGLPFIYGGDIREGVIDWANARRIDAKSSEANSKTQLMAGDLLTVRVGAPGVTAVVPAECEGGNCASVMLIRQGAFNSEWLCYAMNTRTVRFQVEVVQYGAAQEQFNISHAVNFWVPAPPRKEQNEIVTFLDAETAKLDTLAAEAQKAIDLLQERRTALISAAVTGQIDVRKLAAA